MRSAFSNRTPFSLRGRVLGIVLGLAMGMTLVGPPVAQAMDRDVRAVIVAGEYGLVGGTILGLATLPFSKDLRTIFIGSSVGLYLGIAVGFYYIYHRDDPENPLRSDRPGYRPSPRDDEESRRPDPQSRERELRALSLAPPTQNGREMATREPLEVSVAVWRF